MTSSASARLTQEATTSPVTAMPATPTEVHVTSNPDVCIVVSSGDKVFANIEALRESCSFFRTMLGPNFQEGQSIIDNPGCIQEFEFPEDDPQAMITLVRLIHGSDGDGDVMSDVPFPPKSIYEVAVVAHKYDAGHAVMSTLEERFRSGYSSRELKSTWYIACAAYLVGHRKVFKMATSQLLKSCNVPYRVFLKYNTDHREAAMMIALLLEERRGKLRSEVSSQVIDGLDELTYEGPSLPDHNQYHEIRDAVRVSYEHTLFRTLDRLEEYADYAKGCVIYDAADMLRADLDKGICFDCVVEPWLHERHR